MAEVTTSQDLGESLPDSLQTHCFLIQEVRSLLETESRVRGRSRNPLEAEIFEAALDELSSIENQLTGVDPPQTLILKRLDELKDPEASGDGTLDAEKIERRGRRYALRALLNLYKNGGQWSEEYGLLFNERTGVHNLVPGHGSCSAEQGPLRQVTQLLDRRGVVIRPSEDEILEAEADLRREGEAESSRIGILFQHYGNDVFDRVRGTRRQILECYERLSTVPPSELQRRKREEGFRPLAA